METRQDLSMGALVLGFTPENAWSVLLIKQYTENSSYWGIPKGHPNVDETPLQSAVREVNEETGLTITEADTIADLWYDEHYTFVGSLHNDAWSVHPDYPNERLRPQHRIEKTVKYTLAVVDGTPTPVPQEEEVEKAEWLSVSDAHARLRYPAQKRVFIHLLRNYAKGTPKHAPSEELLAFLESH
jgi:8-oxo-dGTP pyrophosphatase MutT (NUDIX family)